MGGATGVDATLAEQAGFSQSLPSTQASRRLDCVQAHPNEANAFWRQSRVSEREGGLGSIPRARWKVMEGPGLRCRRNFLSLPAKTSEVPGSMPDGRPCFLPPIVLLAASRPLCPARKYFS